MAILRIRDENGKVVDVYALKGDKGDKGEPGGSVDEAALDSIIAIQENMLAGKETTPADHIIEQGTIGVWTYRKWASGIAEAWCLTGAKDVSNFTASGSIYISPMLTETLPEGVFTEVTCPTVQVRELGAYVVNGCLFYSNANRIEWQVFRHWNDNNTYRLWFYIDVKGRWL